MASKINSDSRTLAIITHVLGLFTGFIGALIILLASQDKYVKKHAKYALNWQISFLIYFAISFVLIFILIGFLFIAALTVMNIVFCIIAAVRASEDQFWKYPMAIQFFKD